MRLLRLHVDNFGTLCNFDLTLEGGMNVLYEKNGWGKSTLAVFIKAMLYGLPASSKRSLDENERKKYTPWQGGSYGGSLEFETSLGKFRIERSFATKESGDYFALYDLSTNKPSTAYSSALGEELFGIDADGFERSTYLSQRALTGGKDNNSISAKLGNLLDDVGDIGNFDTAMEALDRRRRYYVMTGNRGAIADLEREILSLQGELERLLRVEEAMHAQEEELFALEEQLSALGKLGEENRKKLELAGLARERSALMEQKNRMLSELAALTEQKERLKVCFQGKIPTAEELNENKGLWEQISAAKARLDTISAVPVDPSLERLRARFSSGLPREVDLDRIERDNETLRELRIRMETLQQARETDGLSRRFAEGAPEQSKIDEAFGRLSDAEKLQKAIDTLVPPPLSAHSPLLPVSILFGVLGVCFLGLGFLPMLASVALPLWIGGGVSLAVGVVLSIALANFQTKKKRQRDELQKKRASWQKRKDDALVWVREFLIAYRMPTEDLSRSLTELSLFAERYRETSEQRRRTTEQINEINRRREEIRARLHAYLSRFIGAFPQKEDYREEVERLRRDHARLLQAEAAEAERISDRRAAEETLRTLKLALQPFLRRYDPEGELRARECLERVTEQVNEYHRLSSEIAQKETALRRFVSEKNLDRSCELDHVESFESLADEQRKLQLRSSDLEQNRARLRSSVERLAIDTDRIPELEARLSHLGLQLTEAKKNSDTVKNTARFLEEAKNALSTRYLDGMQKSFHELLSALIGKEAPESVIDSSFEVALRPDGGQTRTMESFSRGWRDAAELCIRLSLTEALYEEGEKPFLLLDDPLVNLDDERLFAARRLLEQLSQKYQILYLVCHKDRI